MTKIKDFIQTHIILPRLLQYGVLVVYDPERRYRALCQELANERRRVIDATESSITSRLAGMQALQEFGAQPAGAPDPAIEAILVYVPAPKPRTDDEKLRDPFAVFGACGGVFPEGDGDEYQSLCLKARADYWSIMPYIWGRTRRTSPGLTTKHTSFRTAARPMPSLP